jgi:hypothetical protein
MDQTSVSQSSPFRTRRAKPGPGRTFIHSQDNRAVDFSLIAARGGNLDACENSPAFVWQPQAQLGDGRIV